MCSENSHASLLREISEFQALKESRISGIIADISKLANAPISFPFNPKGTQLYSIEETKRSFARRFLEISECINLLRSNKKVVSGAILGRALIESVAMACYFVDEIDRLISAGSIEKFNERMKRFLAGTTPGDTKPMHVMDALRHLHELDDKYAKFLWSKYTLMGKLMTSFTGAEENGQELLAQISVMKNYDLLSNFAHPNGLGVFWIFGNTEGVEQPVDRTLHLLDSMSASAIWQGHHLISAYDRSERVADRYLARFGTSEAT
jgi:hypothetical protein